MAATKLTRWEKLAWAVIVLCNLLAVALCVVLLTALRPH